MTLLNLNAYIILRFVMKYEEHQQEFWKPYVLTYSSSNTENSGSSDSDSSYMISPYQHIFNLIIT
jgi:hypothetical protein